MSMGAVAAVRLALGYVLLAGALVGCLPSRLLSYRSDLPPTVNLDTKSGLMRMTSGKSRVREIRMPVMAQHLG